VVTNPVTPHIWYQCSWKAPIRANIAHMKISLGRAALVSAIILVPFDSLTSQTSQAQRIPQFENSDVKVWKTTVMPNAPLSMHTHEHARVIVALSGGTMKIAYEDGTSEIEHWETGKAYWLSAEEGKKRHADQNVGDKPIEVMVVEVKNDK
jgi:beta-alanine degradation protein BauB